MVKKKDPTLIVIILVIALIGIFSLVFATRWGIGLTPDSINYIGSSRNLLEGRGFIKPNSRGTDKFMTHWPPFYPLLLAIVGLFKIDPLNGAKFLNLFLFGINIVLIGLIIKRHTQESIWPSVFGSLLILTSISMLSIHSMAWTEPLFLFLALLGLVLLTKYMETSKLIFLIASSLSIGFAFITRYPGITLIITGIIAIFLFSNKSINRKFLDTFIFGGISFIPMLLWIIRNLLRAGKTTNRKIVYHPINKVHIDRALLTFSTWLLPKSTSNTIRNFILLLVILGLLIGGILLIIREKKCVGIKSIKECILRIPNFLKLIIIFIFVYLIFLAISISLFDAHTKLDNRILSPIFVSVLILSLCLGYRLIFFNKKVRLIQIVSFLICIGFLGSYLFRSTNWVIKTHNLGQEYASKDWINSEILEIVKGLPSDVPIFSNSPDAIYIHTGRSAMMIPAKIIATTRQINKNCVPDLKNMWAELTGKDGVIVYFNTIRRWYLLTEIELNKILSLHIFSKKTDGTIYQANTKKK